jgi:transcriptional regulator with XRE-family HTH domain
MQTMVTRPRTTADGEAPTTRPMPKSRSEDIFGPNPELTRRLREILQKSSTRQADLKTGISHSVINDALSGKVPTQQTLLAIARGYKVNANELFQLAGYPEHPIYDLEYRLSLLPSDPEPERTARAVESFERWYEEFGKKK